MRAVCPLPPIKPLSATNGDNQRGSTGPIREAHAASDGPAVGGCPNAKAARHALDRMAGSADLLTAALLEIPRDFNMGNKR
jgi:hypothetical protein